MKKYFSMFLFFLFSQSLFCSNPYIEAAKSYPSDYHPIIEASKGEGKIQLKYFSLDIEKIREEKIEKFDGKKYFILKSGDLFVPHQKTLSVERIQDDLFLIKANFDEIEELKKKFPNILIVEYRKEYKIEPSLLVANWREPIIIEALLQKGEKPESLISQTKKHFFISALGDEERRFRLRWLVKEENIKQFAEELAEFNQVSLVYPWFLPSPLNDDSIWVIQSYDTVNKQNYSLSAVMFNHGILGESEIATVCDTGLDNDMCYFSYNSNGYAIAQYPALPQTGTVDMTKKVVCYSVLPGATAYDNDSNCGAFNQYHGTHTSGTLVGDNFANLSSETNIGHDSADGMAPMAKMYFQDAGDDISGCLAGLSSDYYLIFQQSYDAGARVHSNSWGSDAEGEYTTDSFSVDDFCYRNDDFVICFAAGNSGYVSQTINTPATAKNCITVGSLTNGSILSNKVSDFSSKGPTKDGRIKPDLCAPGENILSASGTSSSQDRNCDFKAMSGTSMATPTLAGGAVLLRNYFRKGFYPSGEEHNSDSFEPSSALIKSALVAGAMDVGTKDFPNFSEGFGRINLDRFCFFKVNDKYNLRGISYDVRNYAGLKEGEEMVFNFTAKGYLKIALCWTDPPSSLLSSKTLVNNLDLKVISPSGQVYYGNNFQNGVSVSGGNPDAINNIELFFLENCEQGIWQIKVVGTDIKGSDDYPYSDRQGFALSIVKESIESSVNIPQISSVSDEGSDGIKIEWGLVEGADSYSIYRIEESGKNLYKQTFIGQTSLNYFYDKKVQGGYSYS
ncbi:MAG: S8 family serine peptidase, partial [Acidobacteria bacterium]|nr:S8 family serine peptidase [Acidobacteriota bacterium]